MAKFWQFWNRTDDEVRYAAALDDLLPLVLRTIGQKHILSIYIGGSFARREIVDGSDIDLYVIVKDEQLEKAITATAKITNVKEVPVQVHVYAMGELEKQQHIFSDETNRRMPPSVLLRELQHFKCVFGEKIDFSKHALMDDQAYLRAFIPMLRLKIADAWREDDTEQLRFIAKQLFFLVHHEIKRKETDSFSRDKIIKHLEEETTHIIHLCDAVRKNPDLSAQRKKEFLNQVSKYLDDVEKRLS